MCNFHESVAVRAATDETGNIHAGHRVVIRVALSRFWAERYVEGGENVNGYNPYPLATKEQQAAFERSGLKRPLSEVEREETEAIAFLRGKMAALEAQQDLSAKALKLPIATARESFIDMAISHFYKGDPKGEFSLVDTVERDDLKPLHQAVSRLHADPQTRNVLERLVQGKICTLYSQAPEQVNQTLVDAYENLPERVRRVSAGLSQYGGNIILGGFSGLIGHGVHYGSVLGAGIAAGTASSANLALSGVFLLASYGGWNKFFGGQYQGMKQQVSAFAVQAGLTVAIALGAQSLLEHDHMSSERAVWYASLSPELRDSFRQESLQTYNSLPEDLRLQLDEKARSEGVPPEVYLLVCDGSDPLGQEINAYLLTRAENPPQTSVQAGVPSP